MNKDKKVKIKECAEFIKNLNPDEYELLMKSIGPMICLTHSVASLIYFYEKMSDEAKKVNKEKIIDKIKKVNNASK